MYKEVHAMKRLKKLYPELKLNPSGYTGDLPISPDNELMVDPEKQCKHWLILNLRTGFMSRADKAPISLDEKLKIIEVSEDLKNVMEGVEA